MGIGGRRVKGLLHPFSRALYEQDTDGNILVTDGDKKGRFKDTGQWIEGELRECDPQLCGWVAGPVLANHRVADSDHKS